MSYGIIRIQKFKATAVRGIQSHDLRERGSHTNPDIDPGRSGQNYTLVECQNLPDAIKSRLDTLSSSKSVRKDAVVMAQCLITSDQDFFADLDAEKQRKFFECSLAFVADRYGKENILSAVVHLDEKTPHMHVNLTPIRNGRLTAKDIFNRQEFCALHTDFHKSVGREWSLQRGETREEKRRHLDTEAYKLATRKAELIKEADNLRPASMVAISADDLKPQVVNKKLLGLVTAVETPEGVAERLTEDFVRGPYEQSRQIPALKSKIAEMEKREKDIGPALDELDRFREEFNGLTRAQFKILGATAQGFREKNSKKIEEQRRAKAEAARHQQKNRSNDYSR